MKAKQYAKRFLAEPDDRKALAELANAMLRELSDLTIARNARTPRAVVAIVREQNKKWQRIRELVAARTRLTEASFYAVCALAFESWRAILDYLPAEERALAEDGLRASRGRRSWT